MRAVKKRKARKEKRKREGAKVRTEWSVKGKGSGLKAVSPGACFLKKPMLQKILKTKILSQGLTISGGFFYDLHFLPDRFASAAG